MSQEILFRRRCGRGEGQTKIRSLFGNRTEPNRDDTRTFWAGHKDGKNVWPSQRCAERWARSIPDHPRRPVQSVQLSRRLNPKWTSGQFGHPPWASGRLNEQQFRAQCSFCYRFRIIIVVLLTLFERFHINRRNDTRLKSELAQRATDKVGTQSRSNQVGRRQQDRKMSAHTK